MRIRVFLFSLIAILSLLTGFVPSVFAARGGPGSAEFGIGARISLFSPDLNKANETMKALHLDWLAIDFPWSAFYPEPSASPDWSALEQTLQAAHQSNTSVLISISSPPAWATTDAGPNPELTRDLVLSLIERFPGAIQAVELFPGANTRAGWGTSPNPAQYLAIFQLASTALAEKSSKLLVLPGSLDIYETAMDPNDQTDYAFLQALFALDSEIKYPILGLRYRTVQGTPAEPDRSAESAVLRHYENIREMVKSSGRTANKLWITYLAFPQTKPAEEQAAYLSEAYTQIRSQLYIGTAFLQSINSCSTNPNDCTEVSLSMPNGTTHPFFSGFQAILAINNQYKAIAIPGRAKSTVLNKTRFN